MVSAMFCQNKESVNNRLLKTTVAIMAMNYGVPKYIDPIAFLEFKIIIFFPQAKASDSWGECERP